jgi:hypothetical protein
MTSGVVNAQISASVIIASGTVPVQLTFSSTVANSTAALTLLVQLQSFLGSNNVSVSGYQWTYTETSS